MGRAQVGGSGEWAAMGIGAEAADARFGGGRVVGEALGGASREVVTWGVALGVALRLGGRWPAPSVVATVAALLLLLKGGAALLAWLLREPRPLAPGEELRWLFGLSIITTAIATIVLRVAPPAGVAPSLALVDGALALGFGAALRLVPRLRDGLLRPLSGSRGVALVARPEVAALETRRLVGVEESGPVVGLLVDGPTRRGRIGGARVVALGEFARLLRRRAVTEVIIAPPVHAALASTVQALCTHAEVPCRTLAAPRPVGVGIESITAEALLERPPAQLHCDEIVRMLAGRRVLVTGAGGSIGSELAVQVARFDPALLALVDRTENALFLVERNLEARAPRCELQARLLDVRDAAGVERLFSSLRPDVVFHAAAHKHVPLMERHAAEAAHNNVLGTRTVGDAAHRHGADAFVFISTDKAVNPTSVMGATKRLGELYVQGMARRSETRFVAVRFGNVLGSSGSVLPIFLEQLRRGGPLTVTHPEMRRYFMSIPEACQLVLQAGALGQGGEVFVLDMGAPVRVVDLARRVIERAGLRPGIDVGIAFTGMRPGEKLFEELTLDAEHADRTRHPSIFVGRIDTVPWGEVERTLETLERLVRTGDDGAVVAALEEAIPEYIASGSARWLRDEPAAIRLVEEATP